MADENTPPTLRRRRVMISANVLVQIMAVFALVVMVNWLAARHYSRFDWTKSGYYKISDKTKQVLRSLKEPVKVIVYLQPNTESELDEIVFQDVRNLLKEFKFFGQEKLAIEYVDPVRDLARAQQIIDEYKFDVHESALVIFASGSRSKYVSHEEMIEMEKQTYGAAPRIKGFKAEGAFLSAIQTVTEGVSPAIHFLTGHGERDPEDFNQRTGFSTLAAYIKRDNLTIEKWNLREQQALPTNANAIVIAGPRQKFTAAEQALLDQYLKNRGRLFIMLDPRTQSGLESLLIKWGVQVDDDLAMRKAGALLGTELLDVNAVATKYARHPVTEKLTDVNTDFPYARSVRRAAGRAPGADQPRVTELAIAPVAFWGETDPDTEHASFDPATDIPGPLPLAVAVETGQPRGVDVDLGVTRVIVVGTASFADNNHLTGGNLDFFMSGLNWLLKREQLLAVGPKVPDEFRLNMTERDLRFVYALTIFGMPLAVGLAGLAVWMRRRK